MQSRRPLRSRQRGWAIALAGMLARAGASPNAISLASIGFAALPFQQEGRFCKDRLAR